MQCRYVGDYGDLARYGLLRALIPGRRLGMAWYLYPDEGSDGNFIQYLKKPEVWRMVDKEVFDCLKDIIADWRAGERPRCIAEVAKCNLLPGASFADEKLYVGDMPVSQRREWRTEWFKRVMERLDGCDIVYADPDNGLCDDDKFGWGSIKDWKKLPFSEAWQLSHGRPAVIYHHNSRFPGGHLKEIRHWMVKLPGCTHAFYARRGTARTYFMLNLGEADIRAVSEFVERWREAERRDKHRSAALSKLITRNEML